MKKSKIVLIPQMEGVRIGEPLEFNGKYIVQELHNRTTPSIDSVISTSQVERLMQERNLDIVIRRKG